MPKPKKFSCTDEGDMDFAMQFCKEEAAKNPQFEEDIVKETFHVAFKHEGILNVPVLDHHAAIDRPNLVVFFPDDSILFVVKRNSIKFNGVAYCDPYLAVKENCFWIQLKDFYKHRNAKLSTEDNFTHLHNHSCYSLLDGLSTIDGMVDKVVENGQSSLALTDHGFCFSAMKFQKECRSKGIKPINGVELYAVDDVNKKYVDVNGVKRRFEYHLTVLAMNEVGWKNISKMLTIACRDYNHYVPRVDDKLLFEHSEGLIVLSGCFKGKVAWHLQDHRYETPVLDFDGRPTTDTKLNDPSIERPWVKRDVDKTIKTIRDYKKVFGDRYYIETQSIAYEPHRKIMPELIQIAQDEGVPTVLTNDSHGTNIDSGYLQSVVVGISTNRVDSIGEGDTYGWDYYLKERSEFDYDLVQESAADRTMEIAERCNYEMPYIGDGKSKYLFPTYDLKQDKDWKDFQNGK